MTLAVSFQHSGMTIALALVLGLVCQSIAHHLRLPGLLLLLLTGVLVGPDIAGLIQPETLRDAMPVLVNFAVAIILFEGGMNLELKRLRREQRSIQMLITVGALITAIGGSLAAHYIMGWDWPVAMIFGALVIVTGPTVIGPLLKRLKVKHSVSTVLEAEGVLIDAVGAIAAAAALEYAISENTGFQLSTTLAPLGFGIVFGLAGGFILAGMLRVRGLVPEGRESVFTLAAVCALFQASNSIFHESGIAAVTIGGMVVGNLPGHAHRELSEFKEQLTMLLIGMLFILLAADVRLADVVGLGWPGVATVAVLMIVIRPLIVYVSTIGSSLSLKERLFIGCIGPRGIVAAAVASLVATKLGNDDSVGPAFRALIFTVIAVTVAFAGLFGGPLAQVLGLKRRSDHGWVILGAAELARTLAQVLEKHGEPAICIDRNRDATLAAQEAGIRVIYGNGLKERTLLRAEIDTRAGVIGLSPNGGLNLLFAQKAKQEGKVKRLFVAMSRNEHGISPAMIHEAGGEVLFDHPDDVEIWNVNLRHELAALQEWEFGEIPADAEADADAEPEPEPDLEAEAESGSSSAHLLLVRVRKGKCTPIGDRQENRAGDRAVVLVHTERLEEAHRQLAKLGWRPAVPKNEQESSANDLETAPDATL